MPDTHDYGIGALIGAGLPLLFAVIMQSQWKPAAKAVIAFVLSVVAAVIINIFTDTVDFTDPAFDWVTWIGTVYGAAMITYARFWKPTTVEPTIERKTNLTGGPPPPDDA